MGKYKELLVESFSEHHYKIYKAKRNTAITIWIVFIIGLVIFFLK